MAENDKAATPNGNGNGAASDENQPQVSVIAQYVKDLSVENPSAPQVYQWQVQPGLDVQFNLNSNRVGDDVHELAIKIEVAARSDNGVHFVIDLTYAGLFAIQGVPDEALAPFLLTEAPRLLFPFARQIVAEAVMNCGFPPFLLDPIDFTAIYLAQLQQMEQQQGEGQADAALAANQAPATPDRSAPLGRAGMNLHKATGTIGGLTMLSRIAGFAREMLMSRVMGASAAADAFFVAFRLPNTFRRLFGEGAFSAGFVPLYAQRLHSGDNGEHEARAFSEEVLAVFARR